MKIVCKLEQYDFGLTSLELLNAPHLPNIETITSLLINALHRWISMKKKYLSLGTLHIYDTIVSISSEIKIENSWEEARDLTYESLNILGDEYLDYIVDAYANNWIDA